MSISREILSSDEIYSQASPDDKNQELGDTRHIVVGVRKILIRKVFFSLFSHAHGSQLLTGFYERRSGHHVCRVNLSSQQFKDALKTVQ
jgi:hypothetical protein